MARSWLTRTSRFQIRTNPTTRTGCGRKSKKLRELPQSLAGSSPLLICGSEHANKVATLCRAEWGAALRATSLAGECRLNPAMLVFPVVLRRTQWLRGLRSGISVHEPAARLHGQSRGGILPTSCYDDTGR